jgi:hypothetical protein
MKNKIKISPIIRSPGFGYVVENFIGPNVYTGEESPWITSEGKVCVFPNLESVPPKWRQYAQPASQMHVAQGKRMPYRVNIVKEETMKP